MLLFSSALPPIHLPETIASMNRSHLRPLQATVINFGFIASEVVTTEAIIARMARK